MKTSFSRRGIFGSLLASVIGLVPVLVQAKPVPRYKRVAYKPLEDTDIVKEGDFWISSSFGDPNKSSAFEMYSVSKLFPLEKGFTAKQIKGAGQFWRVVGVVDVY